MAKKKRYRKHTTDYTPDLVEMIDVIRQDFRLPEEYSEAFEDYIEYTDTDEDNKTGGTVKKKKKKSKSKTKKIMHGYKAGGSV